VEAIVMDIEGTTTPIDFVTVTMFGYARAHVEQHLRATWQTPATQADVQAMRELAGTFHHST
jgi:methionine salvage enolase-phosphatase E1